MLATKLGKPNQTLDLKITPEEKRMSALCLSAWSQSHACCWSHVLHCGLDSACSQDCGYWGVQCRPDARVRAYRKQLWAWGTRHVMPQRSKPHLSTDTVIHFPKGNQEAFNVSALPATNDLQFNLQIFILLMVISLQLLISEECYLTFFSVLIFTSSSFPLCQGAEKSMVSLLGKNNTGFLHEFSLLLRFSEFAPTHSTSTPCFPPSKVNLIQEQLRINSFC